MTPMQSIRVQASLDRLDQKLDVLIQSLPAIYAAKSDYEHRIEVLGQDVQANSDKVEELHRGIVKWATESFAEVNPSFLQMR